MKMKLKMKFQIKINSGVKKRETITVSHQKLFGRVIYQTYYRVPGGASQKILRNPLSVG